MNRILIYYCVISKYLNSDIFSKDLLITTDYDLDLQSGNET